MPNHPLPRRRSRRLRGQEPGEERSRLSCQEVREHEAKPASAQTQSEALVQVPELSGRCQSSTPVSCVWDRLWREWGRAFCIRLDLHGCYHTYPDVGGPFQSLQETYEAIDRYLEGFRDPKMFIDSLLHHVQPQSVFNSGTEEYVATFFNAVGHGRQSQFKNYGQTNLNSSFGTI